VTRRRPVLAAAAALTGVVLAGVVLSACGSAGSLGTTNGFTVTPTTVTGVTLSTEQTPVGRVLATPAGRTLYDFTPDSSQSSACKTGLCTQLWPPLLTNGNPTVGAGLRQTLVGTIRRPSGTLQVTYGGHPLYTWIGDNRPGMVTGQALLNLGGYWYVIAPSGTQITTPFTIRETGLRH
jgi:predicted lipoprotein with Yx(FWY)xxD motif